MTQGGLGSPSGRILTVPNALTLARIFAIPFVVGALLGGADAVAAVLFVLASVTDFLDGRLARRAGSAPTYIGQVLDPVADRLLLSSTALVLAARGLLPGWAVAVLVGRDLLALVGSLTFRGKIRVNRIGKAATALLMVAVAFVVVGGESLGETMFYAGFGLSMVAGLMYVGKILTGSFRGGLR